MPRQWFSNGYQIHETGTTETLIGGVQIQQDQPINAIDIGRAAVSSVNTTATSAEDIAGLSFNVTLSATSHIVAFLAADATAGTSNKSGFWIISINGVDSLAFERKHSNTSDTGAIFVCFRTASTLAAGNYNVKARWYTETPNTLTAGNAYLAAFACSDEQGNLIPSSMDSVTGDTTTSASLEDVTGLTQTLTLGTQAKIFSVLAASVGNSATDDITVAAVVDAYSTSHVRSIGVSNDRGSLGASVCTTGLAAGGYTVKGQHATASGTLTGDYNQVSIGVEAGTRDIASRFITTSSANTTSASLADITGLTMSITIQDEAHIFALMDVSSEVTSAGADAQFAISINGTDFPVITRTHSSANDVGNAVVLAVSPRLAAGTYEVKGRWATDAGTLSTTATNLFAMPMETVDRTVLYLLRRTSYVTI